MCAQRHMSSKKSQISLPWRIARKAAYTQVREVRGVCDIVSQIGVALAFYKTDGFAQPLLKLEDVAGGMDV